MAGWRDIRAVVDVGKEPLDEPFDPVGLFDASDHLAARTGYCLLELAQIPGEVCFRFVNIDANYGPIIN